MGDKLSPITLAAAKKSSGGGDTKQILEEIEQTPVEAGGETLSTIDDKLNFIATNLNGKGYTNGIVDRSWFVADTSAQFTYPEDSVYVVAFLENRHPDYSSAYMSNIVNNASEILYDSGFQQDRSSAPYRQIQLQIVKAKENETCSARFGTRFGGNNLAGIFVIQLKGVNNVTVNALKTSGFFTSSYSENIEMPKTYLYITALYGGGTLNMNTPRNLEQIVKEPINDSSSICYPKNGAVLGEIGIVNCYSGDSFYVTCSSNSWSHHTLAVLDVTIEN